MIKCNKIFIERTLEVLNQYDEFKKQLECSYSRTLFINCCVGTLLVSPKYIFNKRLGEEQDLIKWGINPDNIEKSNGGKNVKDVARHLRNSVAHGHFVFQVDDNMSIPINHIRFEDYNLKGQLTFSATLTFSQFRTFVLKITEEVLKEIDVR